MKISDNNGSWPEWLLVKDYCQLFHVLFDFTVNMINKAKHSTQFVAKSIRPSNVGFPDFFATKKTRSLAGFSMHGSSA